MSEWAYRLAQQEYGRLIRQGMGIFLIAEAWDIEPIYLAHQDQMDADRVWVALPNHVRGRGLLTEPYLLGRMAEQIRQMYAIEEGNVLCIPKRNAAQRRKRA